MWMFFKYMQLLIYGNLTLRSKEHVKSDAFQLKSTEYIFQTLFKISKFFRPLAMGLQPLKCHNIIKKYVKTAKQLSKNSVIQAVKRNCICFSFGKHKIAFGTEALFIYLFIFTDHSLTMQF